MARDKPIILSTKCWIPARNLSPAQLDEIDELFTIEQFELRVCAKCRFEHMRPVEQCYGCKGLKGFTELYTKRQTDDGMYVGIPLAQHRKSLEILELQDVDVIDSRPKIKFPQDLHFTGKLYDGSKPGQADQEGIVEKFWNNVILTKKNAGIIRANPRTGKTPLMINIILELGYRAVIIAAELAWLEQFCDDFLKLTNVKKLNNAVTLVSNKISSKHYKDVPGICVVKNVEKIPQESCVTLIPYQGFIHDDLKVAKILHGNYTTLGVDECHQAGAFEYSRLLNNLDVTYRISVSATVDRNDGMSPVVKRLLGNVAVISDDIVMIPELHIVETNISVNSSTHTGRVTSISKNNPRNLIILKTLFDDLKENKDHCLFVAVERVHQMLKLTNMINQQAAHDNAVAREKDEPEPWLFPLALSYSGATYDHKHVRQQATDKAIRVVVAVSKKVKHGISVPAWTHCYITYPIADGPGFYQITQRVCTTYENKPQPHIRVFIDASPDSAKTFRNLYTSPYNSTT